MAHTPEDTALLIAWAFRRSGQKRGRVSRETIRLCSGRRAIRVVFVSRLTQCLDDLGLVLTELDRGGHGLIPYSALDGAPPITARKYLPGELLQRLKHGTIGKDDFDLLRAKLNGGVASDEDGQ